MALDFNQVRELRAKVKTAHSNSLPGYLAERHIFEMLQTQGVAVLESYETASVDGAFRDPTAPAAPSNGHPGHAWRAAASDPATREQPVCFLPFDIKYCALQPAGRKGEPYAYFNPTPESMTFHAEVYLVSFARIDDYCAIVPRDVWNRSTDVAHGLEPLINDIPAWFAPFMVHFGHLQEAVARLFAAADQEGPYYQNPTTCVTLTGWRPTLTQQPPIWPAGKRANAVLQRMLDLWDSLEQLQANCRLNPLQPLFCDFLLQLPGGGDYLRIEHKWEFAFEPGKRSPFYSGRMWHFLICEFEESIFCISRAAVQSGWVDHQDELDPKIVREHSYPKTPSGLQEMLQYMSGAAPDALSTADHVLNTSSEALEIDVMLSSGIERVRRDTLTAEMYEQRQKRDLPEQIHQRGLPHLTLPFNAQCAEQRALVSIPLDISHVFGDKAILDVEWELHHVQAFRDGRAPFRLWARGMHDTRCIVVRSIDLWATPSSDVRPLHLRQANWALPPQHSHRCYLFGSLFQQDMPTTAMVFPGTFTNLYSGGGRPKIDYLTREDSGGLKSKQSRSFSDKYWRFEYQARDTAPGHFGYKSTGKTRKEEQHSNQTVPFHNFVTEADVDPYRYLFNFDSGQVHKVFHKLIKASGPTSIDPAQGTRAGKSFDARQFHTTVQEVLQAMWDFGLTRHARSSAGPGSLAHQENLREQKTAAGAETS